MLTTSHLTPLTWYQNGYYSNFGDEYLGPSDVADLQDLRDFLEDRVGGFDALDGLDPLEGDRETVIYGVMSLLLTIASKTPLPVAIAVLGSLSDGAMEEAFAQIQVIASYEDFF